MALENKWSPQEAEVGNLRMTAGKRLVHGGAEGSRGLLEKAVEEVDSIQT